MHSAPTPSVPSRVLAKQDIPGMVSTAKVRKTILSLIIVSHMLFQARKNTFNEKARNRFHIQAVVCHKSYPRKMSGVTCSLQIPGSLRIGSHMRFRGKFGRAHFLALLFSPALSARAAKSFLFAG